MNTRERFAAIMNFQPFDRLPVLEWAHWWDLTLKRWYKEGLPAHLTDRYDLCRYFEMDVYYQHWFPTIAPGRPEPPYEHGAFIQSMADYERLRPWLYPEPAQLIDPAQWTRWGEEQRDGKVVIWFSLEGFFWFPRVLLGIQPHLFAFYEKPELMHRINTDLAQWMIRVIEAISQYCHPDFMTFAEDMSYNHGPMLSPALFDEFMKPYYQQVIPHLTARGILPLVDSDGDISLALEWFEEAGLKGILPLERQAGVDVAALRRSHPHARLLGSFDKMSMPKGEAAMRAEFERLLPVAAGGGLIIGCDHQTPPGVSLENYRIFLRLFREYAQQAGSLSRQGAAANAAV